METMLHRIIGDDVSVGIKLATDLSPVEADRAQIERVILNLAANARDAMPDGGALTIETANVDVDAEQVASHGDEGIAGPHVLLAVSDTGHGMDEDVAKHLFEPFFTTKGAGHGHRARPRDGVRRRQAERRRDLRLQRARPRHDVQDLPAGRRGARRTPASPRPSRSPEGGTETIMVVEDDDGVRDLVRLMLEANGYEVLTVRDADEAARVCTERPCGIDLLLTDVMMPEVNGRVLAERLGALAPVDARSCSCRATPTRPSTATACSARAPRSWRSRSPSARSRARCARSSTLHKGSGPLGSRSGLPRGCARHT